MKTKLLFNILLFVFGFSFAQNGFTCATVQEDIPIQNYNRQASSDDDIKYTINVRFHMVNDNDGNNLAFILGTDFEDLAMQAITYLNVNYNPYNIYFKYRGFDTHNNTTATTTANGTTINGIYQPGYLNIFFVNSAGGASGLAYFGSPVCWMAWETLQDPYYSNMFYATK